MLSTTVFYQLNLLAAGGVLALKEEAIANGVSKNRAVFVNDLIPTVAREVKYGTGQAFPQFPSSRLEDWLKNITIEV